MKTEFSAEAVSTLHWIPTGQFKLDKKTGKMKEVKRKVVHRRVFLTAVEGVSVMGARNLRIVAVRRGGKTTYSLSERKEKLRPWWEKAPPDTAKVYTRVIESGRGKPVPPMTDQEVISFLTLSLGSEDGARRLFNEFAYGEPLEGDDRWDALERYGYERPEYEEDEESIAA